MEIEHSSVRTNVGNGVEMKSRELVRIRNPEIQHISENWIYGVVM